MPHPIRFHARCTVEVQVTYYAEREGFHVTEFGELWGTYEKPVELRAEVTYFGINEVPEVEWLDKGVVEDSGLTDSEVEGAEELAIEAAYQKLTAEAGDGPDVERGDHMRDQMKDAQIWEAS